MSQESGQESTTQSQDAPSPAQVGPAGVRHSKAYNLILGVVIVFLGLFVLWQLNNTFGSVDGAKLAELTRKRAELKVAEYLAGKKVKHVAQDGTVGGDMTFTVGEFKFLTPVDGLKTLPEVVTFEMTLPSQGHPENKPGKVRGEFNKGAGEMHLLIDMVSYGDSLSASFIGSKVD